MRSSEVPVILYCVHLGLEECGSLIACEYILAISSEQQITEIQAKSRNLF